MLNRIPTHHQKNFFLVLNTCTTVLQYSPKPVYRSRCLCITYLHRKFDAKFLKKGAGVVVMYVATEKEPFIKRPKAKGIQVIAL